MKDADDTKWQVQRHDTRRARIRVRVESRRKSRQIKSTIKSKRAARGHEGRSCPSAAGAAHAHHRRRSLRRPFPGLARRGAAARLGKQKEAHNLHGRRVVVAQGPHRAGGCCGWSAQEPAEVLQVRGQEEVDGIDDIAAAAAAVSPAATHHGIKKPRGPGRGLTSRPPAQATGPLDPPDRAPRSAEESCSIRRIGPLDPPKRAARSARSRPGVGRSGAVVIFFGSQSCTGWKAL